MFREMRRRKQQVSKETCVEVLNEAKRGVLAMSGDEGYPYAIPLDFYYDEPEDTIYFHCARQGHKIDILKNDGKVCFTTWNAGVQEENGWAYYVTSVVIFGTAELVTDDAVILEKARKFGLKYYPSAEELEVEIEKDLHRVQMVAIHVDHMTGKLVHEK